MNAAVTIETRSLDYFPEVVRNHMKHLPGFELVIFGSEENSDFLSRNLSDFVLHNVKVKSEHDYNRLLATPKFWELLCDYERVLIFQHDSGILRDGIDEFLKWDYVGSPWTFQQHGGNGGLSVRNPKVMFATCRDTQWNQHLGNEDVFFCNILNTLKHPKFLAPRSVCQKFSCETIFQLGTFGYHAIDQWLTPKQCVQIKEQYRKNIVHSQ